ncbi:MAG: type II toxin-antitoxin system RelE/ParE family toxin [Burkholderiales bacterium]
MTLKVVFRPVDLVSKHPDRYPVKHKDIRSVRAHRFPYSIFYTVESRQIVVLAVFHARRDPAVWQARLRPRASSRT